MSNIEAYARTKELLRLYSEQEAVIKERKNVLSTYQSKVKKLKVDSEALNKEISQINPTKILPKGSLIFSNSSSSESEDEPVFIPVEKIYLSEINSLKQEKNSLKKHISQLLHVLNRDPEENEEYSSGEWEDIPEKSPEKKLDLNPSISAWQPIPFKDDYRVPTAYKTGGLPLTDEKIQAKLRSVGKELVREIGRKILNGDFNLTRVSVHIKCMQANTALHNTLKAGILLPAYLQYAGRISDPLERLKLVISSSIGTFFYLSTFEKPINPVLGETLYAVLEDGSEMYAEQSSHHPPISHYHIENPYYRQTGYFNFSAKAGLNSVTVYNYGKKFFQFPDGHTITQNCGEDHFGGTFFGTLRHECIGVYKFTDHTYGYNCAVKVGIKDKPSDYLEGTIFDKNGKAVSQLFGTWIGYLEFDGVRYWDVRHIKPAEINFKPNLPSDSENRNDLKLLRQGNVDQAQIAKEEIENLQRHDRKMRDKYHPH